MSQGENKTTFDVYLLHSLALQMSLHESTMTSPKSSTASEQISHIFKIRNCGWGNFEISQVPIMSTILPHQRLSDWPPLLALSHFSDQSELSLLQSFSLIQNPPEQISHLLDPKLSYWHVLGGSSLRSLGRNNLHHFAPSKAFKLAPTVSTLTLFRSIGTVPDKLLQSFTFIQNPPKTEQMLSIKRLCFPGLFDDRILFNTIIWGTNESETPSYWFHSFGHSGRKRVCNAIKLWAGGLEDDILVILPT